MRRPCEVHEREIKPNGLIGKMIKKYSYTAVLCEIEGDRVMAVRLDGCERKTDIHKAIDKEYPGWKVKAVHKLYDDDFRGV